MKFSIVKKSKLERTLRLDAEFFKPQYINLEQILFKKKKNLLDVTRLCNISDGNHFSVAEQFIYSDGIPYYRGQDLSELFIENVKPVMIPQQYYDKPLMKRSHFKIDDILLSIVGTVGNVSIITNKVKKSTGSCKIAILRPFNKVDSKYLSIFLISKFGKYQVERNTRGAVQTGLILEDMNQILVYNASPEFKKKIGLLVDKSLHYTRESQELFESAQSILLMELGLERWHATHQLTFTKKFSELTESNRLDAEHYQPKYYEIINAIKGYKHGHDILDNIVTLKKGIEVGSKEYINSGVPFIRVSNLSQFDLTEEKYISHQLYNKIQENQPQSDEILLSKDATPGIALHLNQTPPKMINSGGILRLKLKNNKRISPEYLTLVLNSTIVKQQVNRDVGGSIILHWRPEQVKNTLVPVLKWEKQQLITEKVNKSKDIRKRATALIDSATKAIEIAVQVDESAALKWLEHQLNKEGE